MTHEIWSPIISAAAGLCGVFAGGWVAARNDKIKRRAEFVARQLSEFYGPILSLRGEIKALSDLRVRIENAGESEWQRLNEDATTPDARQRIEQKRWPEFAAILEDSNVTFREKLIPAYREMVTIFRDKMWLAEPATRVYFDELVEFVEVWERFLRKALPGEVVEAIGHRESNLYPFYDHLNKTYDRLRDQLASPSR